MLRKLFKMQEELNDYIFKKKVIRNQHGEILKMIDIINEAKTFDTQGAKIGVNSDVNKWLGNYLTALNDESRELRDELPWKFWSKDSLDMQNIRVEIVDQLHFWLSIAMSAGLDAEKTFSIYEQKYLVNIKRQQNDYSKANKDESDNKDIK